MPYRTTPASRAGSPGPRRALRSSVATLRFESVAIWVAVISTPLRSAGARWRPAAAAGAAAAQAAGQAGAAAGYEIVLVSHVNASAVQAGKMAGGPRLPGGVRWRGESRGAGADGAVLRLGHRILRWAQRCARHAPAAGRESGRWPG